jgi:hypothetical protein
VGGGWMDCFILGESVNLIRDEVDLILLTKGKQALDSF